MKGRVLSLLELGTGLNPLLTGRQNVVKSAALLAFEPDYVQRKLPEVEAFAELGDFFDSRCDSIAAACWCASRSASSPALSRTSSSSTKR